MNQNYIRQAQFVNFRAARYGDRPWRMHCIGAINDIIAIICTRVTYKRGSSWTLKGHIGEAVDDLFAAFLGWGHEQKYRHGTQPYVQAASVVEKDGYFGGPLTEDGLLLRAWLLEGRQRMEGGLPVKKMPRKLRWLLAMYGLDNHVDFFNWCSSTGRAEVQAVGSLAHSTESVPVPVCQGASVSADEHAPWLVGEGAHMMVEEGAALVPPGEEESFSDWLNDPGWMSDAVRGFVSSDFQDL